MKIATWNVNSINSRVTHVLQWCLANEPDVLCLQETKCVDSRFPISKLKGAGLRHIAVFGEKAYNGVAIASRRPIGEIQRNFPADAPDAPRRLLAGTVDGVRIVNVYAPHGTKLRSEKFTQKLEWLERLRRYFDDNFSHEDNVLLCGDLNVAPHEMDVWKPSLWKDKLHFSKPERDAIFNVKRWGFHDLFRELNNDEREFSWWSNFHNDFEKDRGLRIDHIWASPAMADLCVDCWIDRAPRGLEKPSDHAPVVAEFRP